MQYASMLNDPLGVPLDYIFWLTWEESAMILVVDDEQGIREVLVEYLNLLGYEADAVENGKEALAVFDENKYDLVITDNNMPAMSGTELIKSIRRNCPFFPVIGFTGGSTEGLIEAGATRCFSKPCDLDEMRNVIEDLLSLAPTESLS